MKTSVAKQKGRRLQQQLRDVLRYIFRGTLEDGDIESRGMGSNGSDLIFSPASKKLIPFEWECKNQESLNIWKSIEQAESNSNGRIPAVVFSKNRAKTYICLELDEFLKIQYPNYNPNEYKIFSKS